MVVFRKIWHALFSLNTRFEIRRFALLPTSYYFSDYGILLRKYSAAKIRLTISTKKAPSLMCGRVLHTPLYC